MPKKIKNVFYKNLTFEKLLSAHKRARKHKAYKNDVNVKIKLIEKFKIKLIEFYQFF